MLPEDRAALKGFRFIVSSEVGGASMSLETLPKARPPSPLETAIAREERRGDPMRDRDGMPMLFPPFRYRAEPVGSMYEILRVEMDDEFDIKVLNAGFAADEDEARRILRGFEVRMTEFYPHIAVAKHPETVARVLPLMMDRACRLASVVEPGDKVLLEMADERLTAAPVTVLPEYEIVTQRAGSTSEVRVPEELAVDHVSRAVADMMQRRLERVAAMIGADPAALREGAQREIREMRAVDRERAFERKLDETIGLLRRHRSGAAASTELEESIRALGEMALESRREGLLRDTPTSLKAQIVFWARQAEENYPDLAPGKLDRLRVSLGSHRDQGLERTA